MNVKSPYKGIRKNDNDSIPISSIDDERLIFLKDFHIWLCKWEHLNGNRAGQLTKETMFALKHTVNTYTELVPYLLTELNLTYVLTGKFQTDNLEARFSKYRQFSGSNYHVTV